MVIRCIETFTKELHLLTILEHIEIIIRYLNISSLMFLLRNFLFYDTAGVAAPARAQGAPPAVLDQGNKL